MEEDFKRKSLKLIEESKNGPTDETLEKEYHELKAKHTEVEKDSFAKDKEIEYLKR